MKNSGPPGLLDPLPCVGLWPFTPLPAMGNGPCFCSLAPIMVMWAAGQDAGQHLLITSLVVPATGRPLANQLKALYSACIIYMCNALNLHLKGITARCSHDVLQVGHHLSSFGYISHVSMLLLRVSCRKSDVSKRRIVRTALHSHKALSTSLSYPYLWVLYDHCAMPDCSCIGMY